MKPYLSVRVWQKKINFFSIGNQNLDYSTVQSFGNEWEAFSEFDDEEINFIAKDYFDIVKDGHTQIVVYDIMGRQIKNLVGEIHTWPAFRNLPAAQCFTAASISASLKIITGECPPSSIVHLIKFCAASFCR